MATKRHVWTQKTYFWCQHSLKMSFLHSSFGQGLSNVDRSCEGGWMLASSEMVLKVWWATQMHTCWFPPWICSLPVMRLLRIHSYEQGSPLAQAGLVPQDWSCLCPSALSLMRRKTFKCSLEPWLQPVHSTVKLDSLVSWGGYIIFDLCRRNLSHF